MKFGLPADRGWWMCRLAWFYSGTKVNTFGFNRVWVKWVWTLELYFVSTRNSVKNNKINIENIKYCKTIYMAFFFLFYLPVHYYIYNYVIKTILSFALNMYKYITFRFLGVSMWFIDSIIIFIMANIIYLIVTLVFDGTFLKLYKKYTRNFCQLSFTDILLSS